MSGWIGVDLDGTLAHYDGWKGGTIGEPIPAMVERVKGWIDSGKTVKIFTARVCTGDEQQIALIKEWCKNHIGVELEVTSVKDFSMIELWDDRCVQVAPNTGQPIESAEIARLESELLRANGDISKHVLRFCEMRAKLEKLGYAVRDVE